MKTLIKTTLPALVALISVPTAAQPSSTNMDDVASFSVRLNPVSSVIYRNAGTDGNLSGNTATEKLEDIGSRTSITLKHYRPKELNVTKFHEDVFGDNDRVLFTVNAPMKTTNGLLTVLSAAAHTQLDSSVIKTAQLMSLIATRELTAEFAYTVDIDKASKFDAIFSGRLNRKTDSDQTDLAASVNYVLKF